MVLGPMSRRGPGRPRGSPNKNGRSTSRVSVSEPGKIYGWENISQFLGIARRSLQRYEEEGILPLYRTESGMVWANISDLNKWIQIESRKEKWNFSFNLGWSDGVKCKIRLGRLDAAYNAGYTASKEAYEKALEAYRKEREAEENRRREVVKRRIGI